jgi:inorganic pyrophosphatase
MLEATLPIVIEQRAGERGRWEWVAADDAIVYQHDLEPMPEHYGCSVDIINPGDGELLDVIVADDRPRERNEKLAVRVVDMLERSNNDHKLLAVPVDVSPFDGQVLARLNRARQAAYAWFVDTRSNLDGRWVGEDAAMAAIAECRAWTEAQR